MHGVGMQWQSPSKGGERLLSRQIPSKASMADRVNQLIMSCLDSNATSRTAIGDMKLDSSLRQAFGSKISIREISV